MVAVALFAAISSVCLAQDERYKLREDFRVGRNISHVVNTSSSLPQKAKYFQLGPPQKVITRSWYVNLNEADDPPYPDIGIGFMLRMFERLSQDLDVQGELALELTVNQYGKVESVRVIRSPSPELARRASRSAQRATFTPGLCQSLPCTMPYPIGAELFGCQPRTP
jgi:hypothetical protein